MIDGHIHLERGSYTVEWINEFVGYALKRGISELQLLEHSHRFYEFASVYESVYNYNEYQREWLKRKMKLSIESYKDFITQMKKKEFPVKLKFGLEICYIEDKERLIRDLLGDFDWDFVTGSVHWIDGWGFDHKKEFWEGKDTDREYKEYYKIMKNLIKSDLFDIVAHPDSIKCFGNLPACDMSHTYSEIADLLNEHNMFAEQSAGLFNNYGYSELGMNKKMLEIFKSRGVKLITVSDAHRPEDVGRNIREMHDLLI